MRLVLGLSLYRSLCSDEGLLLPAFGGRVKCTPSPVVPPHLTSPPHTSLLLPTLPYFPFLYPFRRDDALWVGGHLAAGARAHRGARTHPHQGAGRRRGEREGFRVCVCTSLRIAPKPNLTKPNQPSPSPSAHSGVHRGAEPHRGITATGAGGACRQDGGRRVMTAWVG